MLRLYRWVTDDSEGNGREIDKMKFPAQKYRLCIADDDDDDDDNDDDDVEGMSCGAIQLMVDGLLTVSWWENDNGKLN